MTTMGGCRGASSDNDGDRAILVLIGVVVGLIFLLVWAVKENGGALENEDGMIVKIERQVGFSFNPKIEIVVKSARLNYSSRKLVLEGVSNFAGNHGGTSMMVVPKVEIIDGGVMVIKIPDDADYEIYLGEKYTLLNKIINDQQEEVDTELPIKDALH